jgi:hypothetical protein
VLLHGRVSITLTILPKSRGSRYPKVAAKLDDLNLLQACPSLISRITKPGFDGGVGNLRIKCKWLAEVARSAIQAMEWVVVAESTGSEFVLGFNAGIRAHVSLT